MTNHDDWSKLVILHLSDTHFIEEDDAFVDSVFSSLLTDIESSDLTPNMIIFSGDLVDGCKKECSGKTCKHDDYPADCPLPKQYERAKTFFNKMATQKNIKLDDIPLLIVPGNHDVNRKVVSHIVKTGCRPSNEDTANNLIDDESFSDVQKKQKYWFEQLEELSSFASWNKKYYFPYGLFKIGEKKVGFVGLNSCLGCFDDQDKGKLWIHNKQFEEAAKEVEGADFKIIAMHHPTDWIINYEKSDLSKKLELRFNIFFHGHEHDEWFVDSKNFLKVASGATQGC